MDEGKKVRVLNKFNSLLIELDALKPNDRSKEDRYWAITITDVEKAFALFYTFVTDPELTQSPQE